MRRDDAPIINFFLDIKHLYGRSLPSPTSCNLEGRSSAAYACMFHKPFWSFWKWNFPMNPHVYQSIGLPWFQVLLLCSSWSICFRIMPGTLWLLSVVRAGEGGICANPRDFAAPRDLKNICTRRDNNNVINIQEVYIYPSIAETMSALALRVQKGGLEMLCWGQFFLKQMTNMSAFWEHL